MKNVNRIINTLLVSLSFVVASIFIFGVLKPSENVTEQSSTSNVQEKLIRSFNNQDELTNKYMKELQVKLKKDELESSTAVAKSQQNQKQVRKSKDEDWTKVPLEQQISKDEPFTAEEGDRSMAGHRINLNKFNAGEFIEAARKNGYHVILSDTYEVISITPIMNTKGINDSFDPNPAQ